jgi:hypothetical protein
LDVVIFLLSLRLRCGDSTVLWLISITKLLVEIAALALVGQWILGALIGPKREHNGVYQLLQTVASPALRVAECLSPAWVLPQHRPLVAAALLLVAWVGLTLTKVVHCLNVGLAQCVS